MPSASNAHRFGLHGVVVELRCEDSKLMPAIDGLLEDFENFARDSAQADVEIQVTISARHEISGGGWGKTRLTPKYSWYPRVCDHGGGTSSVIHRRGRIVSLRVDGRESDHVREIAYVAILSLMGWELEKRGFVRLHALAIVEGERARLFQLPPKGGKSTLALECLRSGIEVLGDEVVLVKDMKAHAFPIRIAVAAKTAAQFSGPSLGSHRDFQRKTFDKKSLISLPAPRTTPLEIESLVFQSRSGLSTSLAKASAFSALLWVTWTCLGLGLPQMREFIVRAEEAPSFFAVGVRRLAFALRYLWSRKLVIGHAIESVEPRELKPRIEWARSSAR